MSSRLPGYPGWQTRQLGTEGRETRNVRFYPGTTILNARGAMPGHRLRCTPGLDSPTQLALHLILQHFADDDSLVQIPIKHMVCIPC